MAPVKKAKPQAATAAKAKQNESADEAAEQTVISGQLEKKIKKQQVREDKKRGIVFIKHLPHGFFEEQLKKYFEQFGEVTRLRLARSRRTGNSKGFAFVEFEYPEVAQVAADTMHNYLMFKKVIKASYIPPEKQRLNYFKTTVRKVKNKAGKEIWVSSKTRAINRKVKEHNDWSDESYQKRTARGLRKLEQLKSKFGHLGIDFSKVVIAPKQIKASEKSAAAEEEAQASSSAAVTIKSGKRKTPTEIVAEAQAKQKNAKKSKKELKPADLLGNTINEDSDDEDFIPMAASEDEEYEDLEEDEAESSDEETYMLSDEDQEPEKAKKSKKSSKLTSVKQPKLDRFEELLKRKAFKGGVQKLEKKTKATSKPTAAQKTTKKAKNLIQVAAAKEVAKPLKAIKKAKSLQKPLTAPKKKTRQ